MPPKGSDNDDCNATASRAKVASASVKASTREHPNATINSARHQEIRRDRPNSRADHLFRVYLDNFDELRKVDKGVAELVEGKPSDWTLAIRESYTAMGLPRHPKKWSSPPVPRSREPGWMGVKAQPLPSLARWLGT